MRTCELCGAGDVVTTRGPARCPSCQATKQDRYREVTTLRMRRWRRRQRALAAMPSRWSR